MIRMAFGTITGRRSGGFSGRPFEAVRGDYRVSRRDDCVSMGRVWPSLAQICSERSRGTSGSRCRRSDLFFENRPEWHPDQGPFGTFPLAPLHSARLSTRLTPC